MRRIFAALGATGWLCLVATGAGAETYHILSGKLTDSETGRTRELTGAFEVRPGEPNPESPLPAPLLVEDFEFRAGGRRFAPRGPVEYLGLTPSPFIEVANQIQVDGDRVGLVYLRSGGEPVAADRAGVTYRFLDFRSDDAYAQRAVGRLGDGALPRRLQLEGTVHEVDQRFVVSVEDCDPPPPEPLPPGGGIIIGSDPTSPGGGVTIRVEFGDRTSDELEFFPDRGASIARIGGAPQRLSQVGTGIAATPADLTITAVGADVTPRVEDGGSVVSHSLGSDISWSNRRFYSSFCPGLQTIVPAAEREVGTFSLVATAAQPVDIDVEPRSLDGRVLPGRRRPLPVVLFGSEDLDLRDVDALSLRLGPGGAAPLAYFGRIRGIRADVDRDRHADLVARFSVREAEIAFGDRFVCVVAETTGGSVIEGCDDIDTMPRSRSRSR